MNFFSDGKLINRQSNETETEPFLPVIVSSTALLLVAMAFAFSLL